MISYKYIILSERIFHWTLAIITYFQYIQYIIRYWLSYRLNNTSCNYQSYYTKQWEMSRVTTKPTYCVCDQHGSRPACASAQSDQDPCCSLLVSLLVIDFVSEQHGSWSDCADAQAGLDPCWSQTHYIGFVVTRLKCLQVNKCLVIKLSLMLITGDR
jgi:hypothetical protein